MDAFAPAGPFEALLDAARRIAADTAALHADDVDRQARFPTETVAALRRAGLLSAAVPVGLGGAGCSLTELGQLCAVIAGACGSSGMVLAMHTIQVGCLVRHGLGEPAIAAFVRDLCEHQWLLASITSEVGTFGNTRASLCALAPETDGRLRLNKQATTGSYALQADALLVTCRAHADAASGDQRLVLVRQSQATLVQTGTWDTLGMRGTCSPPFQLDAVVTPADVLPDPFVEIAAQTMVPWSHVLWAALWTGIATDAVARAASSVRAQARRAPGTAPPTARALADVATELQAMRHHWLGVAAEFDAMDRRQSPQARATLSGLGWSLRFNHLKVSTSDAAPRLVHQALQIIGIPAYKNDSPLSLGRHYRDALSAALMISNDRIQHNSAALLMVLKEDQD